MQPRPQVDHVPLLTTLFGEALKDVGLQIDAERAAATAAAMQRTRAASLPTPAAQTSRQTELIEYLRQRQLLLDVGEIHGAALADGGRDPGFSGFNGSARGRRG